MLVGRCSLHDNCNCMIELYLTAKEEIGYATINICNIRVKSVAAVD